MAKAKTRDDLVEYLERDIRRPLQAFFERVIKQYGEQGSLEIAEESLELILEGYKMRLQEIESENDDESEAT